jgi:crossover junction endodeoxyribonuclease RuvC
MAARRIATAEAAAQTSAYPMADQIVGMGEPIRVLGIDPGLQCTGYGVVDSRGNRRKLVEAGVIRPDPKHELEDRLVELHQGVLEVIREYTPQAVAVEKLYSHYDRPLTAILMGHARGVICLSAALAGIPVFHYPATNVKKILTGNGRAPKEQMQTSIQHEFGLTAAPEPHDIADALAVALCHIFTVGRGTGSR